MKHRNTHRKLVHSSLMCTFTLSTNIPFLAPIIASKNVASDKGWGMLYFKENIRNIHDKIFNGMCL